MTKPIIADTKPSKIALEEGKKYFWCSCGKSATQPFCDGAHKGSGMAPIPFQAEKAGDAYLCQCKTTKNPPFCDGTHSGLK